MTDKKKAKLRNFIPKLSKFVTPEEFKWSKKPINKYKLDEIWDDLMEQRYDILGITANDATLADWVGLTYVFNDGKLLIIPDSDFGYEFEPRYYVFDKVLKQGEVFDLFFKCIPDYGQPLIATPVFDRLKYQEVNSSIYPGLRELFQDFYVNYPYDPSF